MQIKMHGLVVSWCVDVLKHVWMYKAMSFVQLSRLECILRHVWMYKAMCFACSWPDCLSAYAGACGCVLDGRTMAEVPCTLAMLFLHDSE